MGKSAAEQAHDREEQARREVGHTDVTPLQARVLSGTFVAALAVVLALEVGWAVRDSPEAVLRLPEMPPTERATSLLERNASVLRSIRAWEDRVDAGSLVVRALRRPVQSAFVRLFGRGNESVHLAPDGWAYYRPDLQHVTGAGFLDAATLKRRALSGTGESVPHPDPRPAVLDLHRQLAARGIELVLVPTPVKPALSNTAPSSAALRNPSEESFFAELRAAGVKVFDPAPVLHRARAGSSEPLFLRADTHWTPAALDVVAQELAGFLERCCLGGSPRAVGRHRREDVAVTAVGDTVAMLQVPVSATAFRDQSVTTHRVLDARTRQPWRSAPRSEVLLLGDSFSNIYSLEGMGWGEHAGLAEQLSFFLGREVDRIARNGGGATAAREHLRRELAAGRDRLAGKRVVAWQFATRELSSGDWPPLDMTLGPPRPASFHVPARGESQRLVGTVHDVSPVPLPGTVPYGDFLALVHLVDLRDADDVPLASGQAIVYTWGMREHAWTDAARYRRGDDVTFVVSRWEDVAERLDSFNQGSLADDELLFQPACWGEGPEE